MKDTAIDFGRRQAEMEANPWSAIKEEKLFQVEMKIIQQLYRENSELAYTNFKSGYAKVFWAGYGVAFFISSIYFLIIKPGAPIVWGTYLFWIPFLWFVPSLIIHSNSKGSARKKALKEEFESAIRAGRESYRSTLNSRKYSSNDEGISRPVATFSEITPHEAEELAAAWLRSLGFQDAKVTRYSRDGGVDVISSLVVCQVKFQESNVGVKPIRELYGVAVEQGKNPVFFSKSSYSAEALEFANKINMPLVQLQERTLHPRNVHAEILLAQGPMAFSH